MKLVKLLFLPFAFLMVALMRALARAGILIRIGEFWSSRVGHFAGNTECYLCEKDESLHPKSFDIWIHYGMVSNRYLSKMFSRVMWIDRTGFFSIVKLVNSLFPGFEKFIAMPVQADRDIYNLFEKYPPHLYFTQAEEKHGRQELLTLGIPEGAKWVCLVVRDSAYLQHSPSLKASNAYRDCDIKSYLLACLSLTERGYYVVRMGAIVNQHFQIRHTKIIDYATSGKRSEFMDIYLGAKCSFCLTTGTGIDAIPYIFRRPMCYADYSQVEYLLTYAQKSLAIFRHHMKDGKRMTLEEIWQSGIGQAMKTADFGAAGITLQDNTPEEIRDVAMEMCDRLEGYYWNDIPLHQAYLGSAGKQEAFWRTFPRSISPYNGKPIHGEIRMRIGREFLKGYL